MLRATLSASIYPRKARLPLLPLFPLPFPLARLCTRRGKHNVNEHINVVSLLGVGALSAVLSCRSIDRTSLLERRMVRENCSNSRPNGDWIADKAVLFPGRSQRAAGLLSNELMKTFDS